MAMDVLVNLYSALNASSKLVLLVDLPVNDKVHLWHKLAKLFDNRSLFHYFFKPFIHCIARRKEKSTFTKHNLGMHPGSLWGQRCMEDVRCDLPHFCFCEVLQGPKELPH